MKKEQVKWDFSKYDYSGISGCPTCEALKHQDAVALAHPETVSLLCEKHYKQFKEWHDSEVKKGNIKSWF